MMRSTYCVAAFLLAIGNSIAAAGNDWPVPRGPSHEPEPYRFHPDHLKKAPKEFLTDAHAVIVHYSITHLVDKDGSVETITHEVTRLNGRKGIAQLGEYRGLTFDPAYQKLTLNDARVIKADGKSIPIQPRHVRLRDSGTNYEVYEAQKELVISFPSLQVGDVYEVKWTTRGKHTENFGHFFTRYRFGATQYPILRDTLFVRLPKNKPLKYVVKNGKVKTIVQENGDRRLYKFRLTNHPALPRDYDLPPREELRVQLMCSTYPSWDAVGRWKNKVREGCWQCTPEIRDIVGKVTKGLKTPKEKAAALTYWVRRKIRYLSEVSAQHRYRPHKPAEVLKNRFGDCKDQAQLLAVMLHEIGLKPRLVTLGLRGDGQIFEDVPSPWGTHAILLVGINGNNHWIDTTAPLAGWDFLPRGDRGRVAYVTGRDGGTEIMRTPGLLWGNNRFTATTLVSVQPGGDVRCSRMVRYYGLAAVNQRDEWLEEPSGERRRKMALTLQDENNRSKFLRLDLDDDNLHSLGEPVFGVVQFALEGQFRGDGDLEAGFTDNHVWNRLLAYTVSHNRNPPMDLGAPFESFHRWIVQLPPAYRYVTESWERKFLSRWGTFRVVVRPDPVDHRKLAIKFYTRISNPRIEPADFEEYRKFHQDVYRNWRVWLAIRPTSNLEDAAALEKALADSPDDLHTAKILARLYLKHDRFSDARRIIEQAKSHAGDDAGLWELAVRTTRTLQQEESLYREMVKRFPKRLDFRIELGRLCVDLGKHNEAWEILTPVTKKGEAKQRARAHYLLARSDLARKNPDVALHHLEEARQLDAGQVDNAKALEFLGRVQESLSEPEKAIAAYQRALRLQPKNKTLLVSLIRLELAARRPRNALVWLRRYTFAVKGNLEGLLLAAKVHLRMGRLDDAYDLALRARDIDFHADGQRILGIVSLRRQRFEKAVFHLQRAHADAVSLEGLIEAHLALGQLPAAAMAAEKVATLANPPNSLKRSVQVVEELLKRKTGLMSLVKGNTKERASFESAVNNLVCAEHAFKMGRPAKNVSVLLDNALQTKHPPGPAFTLRGMMKLKYGRLRSALTDAEEAIRRSPNDPKAFYLRGRILWERGSNKALGDLQTAMELSQQKDGEILHWLAKALWDAGERKQALATQRRAVELAPTNKEMREQLKRYEKKGTGPFS